jgi:hypothetical protein
MVEEDMSKTAFHCTSFISVFEWVVMTFGLKNISATYQRAMNLIFHDLLGIILEIYIDDVVVKLDSMDSHLANLRLALERMRQYGIPFWLYIAVEDSVIGVVLTQVTDGKEHIITYLSWRLIDAETRYSC